MQGFNRYFPPDFDPQKHVTLNSYHGKHALGDRARKIDKGILIVRFELPFNIWCLTCNNHIGMGVRYNAEKRKIGNYYTTPIYSFRCKCHLCDGWFEIQTDPKITAYVVTSGARKQEQDWDPEENGGFAAHETNAGPSGVTDAFASVEKTTAAESNLNNVIKPRLSSLAELSDRRNQDPYTLSSKLRRSFREIKKVDKRIRDEEDSVRDKFALPKQLDLVKEDEVREEAKEMWERGRTEWIREEDKRRKVFDSQFGSLGLNKPIPLSSATKRTLTTTFDAPPPKRPRSVPSPRSTLASTILRNSLKRRDPFSVTSPASGSRMPAQEVGVISKK